MSLKQRQFEILATLFIFGVAATLAGQEPSLTYGTKSRQADAPTEAWYKAKAQEISSDYRMTTAATLKNDKAVIKDAYPKVRNFYSTKQFGQSDSQLLSILGHAWSDYRKDNPNRMFTADEFVALAEAYGGLRITSDPPGAQIRVDEKTWVDPTNTEGAAHVGERVIELSMEGFKPETGTALVKQGEWTPFFRKLKKK